MVRGLEIIGDNCVIRDSFIGPYTSVGNDVKILASSIEYSIILDGATIDGINRLEESLIGRFSNISKDKANRNVISMNLGDYSKVQI